MYRVVFVSSLKTRRENASDQRLTKVVSGRHGTNTDVSFHGRVVCGCFMVLPLNCDRWLIEKSNYCRFTCASR